MAVRAILAFDQVTDANGSELKYGVLVDVPNTKGGPAITPENLIPLKAWNMLTDDERNDVTEGRKALFIDPVRGLPVIPADTLESITPRLLDLGTRRNDQFMATFKERANLAGNRIEVS